MYLWRDIFQILVKVGLLVYYLIANLISEFILVFFFFIFLFALEWHVSPTKQMKSYHTRSPNIYFLSLLALVNDFGRLVIFRSNVIVPERGRTSVVASRKTESR